jgi:hypothetical protein
MRHVKEKVLFQKNYLLGQKVFQKQNLKGKKKKLSQNTMNQGEKEK